MARKTTTGTALPGGSRRAGAHVSARPTMPAAPSVGGIRPWHLLFVGVLLAAAAGAVVTREGGTVKTVSIIVAILTAGPVAAALMRTLAPLAAADAGEETEMLAGRTRAALEREKMLVLRSIKEVEFDRGMRKISEADYHEIVPRLRSRAVGLIRQLEGGGGYRALIERDLAARVPSSVAVPPRPSATASSDVTGQPTAGVAPEPAAVGVACPGCSATNDVDASFCKLCGTSLSVEPGTCPECSTRNDEDARFCKSCGAKLTVNV